jgi:hypothetical protein
MIAGRLPPPWDIEEHNHSCYIVRDGNRQALVYVYLESEPGRRTAAGLLAREEESQVSSGCQRKLWLLESHRGRLGANAKQSDARHCRDTPGGR